MKFAVIAGVALAILVAFVIAESGGEAVYALPLVGAGAVFAFVWLSRFKLEITPDALEYQSLLVHRRVQRSEIVDIEYDGFYVATYLGPTVRLTVQVTSGEPLVINAGVLPEAAKDAVLAMQR